MFSYNFVCVHVCVCIISVSDFITDAVVIWGEGLPWQNLFVCMEGRRQALIILCVLVAQLCPTLCDTTDSI